MPCGVCTVAGVACWSSRCPGRWARTRVRTDATIFGTFGRFVASANHPPPWTTPRSVEAVACVAAPMQLAPRQTSVAASSRWVRCSCCAHEAIGVATGGVQRVLLRIGDWWPSSTKRCTRCAPAKLAAWFAKVLSRCSGTTAGVCSSGRRTRCCRARCRPRSAVLSSGCKANWALTGGPTGPETRFQFESPSAVVGPCGRPCRHPGREQRVKRCQMISK